MSTTNIVTVNTSLVLAPTPNSLQRVGGLISQGGTTLTPGTATLVSTLAQLQTLLATGKTIASMTWAANVVTVTTTSPHGWTNGDVIPINIAGAIPTGYNGTFTGTVTGTTTLTYPLTTNPGVETTPGTVTLGAVSELLAMGTTYFAGNGVIAVYVVELGEGTVTENVPDLTTFIGKVAGTPQQIYNYLVPAGWDNAASFMSFLTNYTSTSSQMYFWVTTTVANRAVYAGLKCVYAEVTSPTAPVGEFSLASAFGTALLQNPTSTNKLAPLSYSPSYGTTAYPVTGNQSTLQSLADANVGWVGTGQQGGISSNIIYQGKMSDGNFWNFWYSVDWAQINMGQALANEVINGSSSTLNPLYYNQIGIDRLQNRVVQVATAGVSAGLGNGQIISTKLSASQFLASMNSGEYAGKIVVNAEPMGAYATENPNDYAVGKYAGLSCIWIPQLPFLNVYFNLEATTLLVG